MIGLFGAVLLASLIGSPHCAGMCGPLAILAASGPSTRTQWQRLLATYHLSRLVGYVFLGILAGIVGAALDLSGMLLGIQRTAALFAGGGMIVIGMLALVKFMGRRAFHFTLPATVQGFLRTAHQRISRFSPLPRAAGIGFLAVLLPCGWLYAFVITAAGTANPFLGAAVMASFWMGTLPALVVVMLGVRQLTGHWRVYLPIVTSLVLIATGTYLVTNRAWIEYASLGNTALAASARPEEQLTRVAELPNQEMPCCHAD